MMMYKGMRMLHRPPTLSISKKLKEKQGLYLRKPIGGLRKNPSNHEGGGGGGENGGEKENESDEEESFMDRAKEEKKKREEREHKMKKDKPPSTKEIREWIKSMIEIHSRMVEEEDPSLFPILKKTKKKKKGISKRKDSQVNSGLVRNRPISMQGIPLISRRASSTQSKYLLAHEAGKVLQ